MSEGPRKTPGSAIGGRQSARADGIHYSAAAAAWVRLAPTLGLVGGLAHPLPRVVIEGCVLRTLSCHHLTHLHDRIVRAAQEDLSGDPLHVQRLGRRQLALYEIRLRLPTSRREVSVLFFVRVDELVRRVVMCFVAPIPNPDGGATAGAPSGPGTAMERLGRTGIAALGGRVAARAAAPRVGAVARAAALLRILAPIASGKAMDAGHEGWPIAGGHGSDPAHRASRSVSWTCVVTPGLLLRVQAGEGCEPDASGIALALLFHHDGRLSCLDGRNRTVMPNDLGARERLVVRSIGCGGGSFLPLASEPGSIADWFGPGDRSPSALPPAGNGLDAPTTILGAARFLLASILEAHVLHDEGVRAYVEAMRRARLEALSRIDPWACAVDAAEGAARMYDVRFACLRLLGRRPWERPSAETSEGRGSGLFGATTPHRDDARRFARIRPYLPVHPARGGPVQARADGGGRSPEPDLLLPALYRMHDVRCGCRGQDRGVGTTLDDRANVRDLCCEVDEDHLEGPIPSG